MIGFERFLIGFVIFLALLVLALGLYSFFMGWL